MLTTQTCDLLEYLLECRYFKVHTFLCCCYCCWPRWNAQFADNWNGTVLMAKQPLFLLHVLLMFSTHRCCRCCKKYQVLSQTAFNAKLKLVTQKQQSMGAYAATCHPNNDVANIRNLLRALYGNKFASRERKLAAFKIFDGPCKMKTNKICFLYKLFAAFSQPFIPGNQTPISQSLRLWSSHS